MGRHLFHHHHPAALLALSLSPILTEVPVSLFWFKLFFSLKQREEYTFIYMLTRHSKTEKTKNIWFDRLYVHSKLKKHSVRQKTKRKEESSSWLTNNHIHTNREALQLKQRTKRDLIEEACWEKKRTDKMRLLCLLLMGNSIQAQKKEYPEYLRITGHCWLIFSVEGVILECIWWERKKGRGGGTVEFGRGPYHDLTSSHTIGPFSCCVFQRTYWTLRNLDTYNIGLQPGLHPHRVHSTQL